MKITLLSSCIAQAKGIACCDNSLLLWSCHFQVQNSLPFMEIHHIGAFLAVIFIFLATQTFIKIVYSYQQLT